MQTVVEGEWSYYPNTIIVFFKLKQKQVSISTRQQWEPSNILSDK